MSNEFEYYRVHRSNDNNIPLLETEDNCPPYLDLGVPVENPEPLLFRLGKPVPKKPKMADYHSTPKSVISKKIFDVLSPMKIEGIQLLPARIRGANDELFTNYWAILILNNLECVDEDLSECDITDINLEDVEKLVLDRKKLAAIPLKKRLIFRLKEDRSYQLFHASVVEAIMAIKPEGIRFTNIEEWNEGSFFN